MRKVVVLVPLIACARIGPAAAETPSPVWLTRPCAHEDAVNCYWDAGAAGNGGGLSFFAVRVQDEVCVLYAERRYARRHDHCVPADRS